MKKKLNLILTGILLSLFSFLIYTLSDSFFPTTDSVSNNFTAANIIHNKSLDLTNLKKDLINKGIIDISVSSPKNQKIYSRTPILNGILSVPFFYLSDKLYKIESPSNNFILNSDYYQIIGKRYASLISAISVFIVFFCFLNFSQNFKLSLWGSITYAFGSFIFSTASQANWQHALSALLISLVYFFLIKYFQNNKNKYLVPIPFILLIAYLARPIFITYIIALIILLIFYKKYKESLWSTGIIVIGIISYRLICNSIGIPDGYSNVIVDSLKNINIFYSLKVFISLLISPNCGLFIFHPVFIFSFIGIFYLVKNTINKKYNFLKFPIILFSILNIIFIFGLNTIWYYWPGGVSWGPRLLTEAIIPLLFLSIYYFSNLKTHIKLNQIIFIILLLISTFNSIVCIFCNTGEWNAKYWNNRTFFAGTWEYQPSMINFYIFNKRSFFTKKLTFQNQQLLLRTKTYLLHIPEKRIKIIYDHTDILKTN
ncbi:MAG: hypothetical protein PHX34_04260 [Candidatus Shapirobacteria bacterium]|nr:hypothetical protein [Candidatus Shapirobacteria bacterium]